MKFSRLKRLPSRLRRAARFEIHAHWRRQPIALGSVLYESFSGNGMLDNPEALFRELLAAPDLRHLTHIWALSDPKQYSATVAEFAGDPRVSFVRSGSAAYYRALATSQYLINNATFQPLQVFTTVAAIYFAICWPLSLMAARMERKRARALAR